jgi:hypothetical protein
MNSVNLIGRLTADPEGRSTASGTPITAMRLAIARRAKAGEERGAVFVDITAWDRLGEARRRSRAGRAARAPPRRRRARDARSRACTSVAVAGRPASRRTG